MKLSEIVKQYREAHNMSLRTFASRCGVSHSVIYNVENEKNTAGEPFTPSFETMQKIAAGMGLSVNDLLRQLEDMPIYASEVDEWRDELRSNPDLRMLLSASRNLNEDDIKYLIQLAQRMNRE